MKTKILLIGDVHGKFEALDTVLTNEEPFDLFLSVGDIGDATTSDLGIINKWQHRGYYIKGNHDNVDHFHRLVVPIVINHVTIAGLNGMVHKKNFPNIMALSHIPNINILMTHQAPTGIFDGMGEPVLRSLLHYLTPRLYVFGHVHQYKIKFYRDTFCISLPLITKGYCIAYFKEGKLVEFESVLKRGKKIIRV